MADCEHRRARSIARTVAGEMTRTRSSASTAAADSEEQGRGQERLGQKVEVAASDWTPGIFVEAGVASARLVRKSAWPGAAEIRTNELVGAWLHNQLQQARHALYGFSRLLQMTQLYLKFLIEYPIFLREIEYRIVLS